MPNPRFIWGDSLVFHDRTNLTEECNTDQLEDRQQGELPPTDGRPCEHCLADFEGGDLIEDDDD